MPITVSALKISKKYDDFIALSPASFELNTGEISILTGSNGSGKTTLLSCLSGLILPTSGVVTISGFDLRRDETEVRRRMAFVPDVPRFYLELTAWEHLRFIAMANKALKDFDQRAEDLLRKLDLWEMKDLFPHHFSRGMRLKLGLAFALIRPLEVLLLDEPTSALDHEGVDVLIRELRLIKEQGGTILISTHDPTLSGLLGDRIFTINHGVLEEK